MFLTKLLIVVFGILFQLLGLLSSDVVDILSNALTVRAVCGLTFTLFLLWKRPNEKSIFYSMVLGIIVCVVWIVYGTSSVRVHSVFRLPMPAVLSHWRPRSLSRWSLPGPVSAPTATSFIKRPEKR